jgi:sec-independent protein translocase protein TatC
MIRPLSHDAEVQLVEHLDELRWRIIVVLGALALALALCLWQNHLILAVVNAPLNGRKPLTLGVAEPFMTTLTLSGYAAIVLALPVLLHQVYGFVLPAFSPQERRLALPLLVLIPFLFVAGVMFGYYLVLPRALQFLQGFNAGAFDVQLRASEYYSFVAQTLIAMGALFQVPVGVLAATRLGLTTPAKLRRNRRYALIVITAVAAALPGVDPVSMVLEMVPLVVLYELSIVLASAFGRPRSEVGERVAAAEGS